MCQDEEDKHFIITLVRSEFFTSVTVKNKIRAVFLPRNSTRREKNGKNEIGLY